MRKTLFLALLLAFTATAISAETQHLDARVIGITDGDTITVLDANRARIKIRLAGIDAPEKKQPFGDRSRQNLARQLENRTLHLEWNKADRYGRLVAIVRIDQPVDCSTPPCPTESIDVNLAQITAGLAWHYKVYAKEQSASDRTRYAKAEEAARASQLGLWRDTHPIQPWQWRRGPTDGSIKKSRSNICHAPGSASYASVQKFDSYASVEDCIATGARLPRNAGS